MLLHFNPIPHPLSTSITPILKMSQSGSSYQGQVIEESQTEDVIKANLICNTAGKRNCTCGWYLLTSSICGHQFEKTKWACGARRNAMSNGVVFCYTPAPQHNIDPRRVNALCGRCDRSHAYSRGETGDVCADRPFNPTKITRRPSTTRPPPTTRPRQAMGKPLRPRAPTSLSWLDYG